MSTSIQILQQINKKIDLCLEMCIINNASITALTIYIAETNSETPDDFKADLAGISLKVSQAKADLLFRLNEALKLKDELDDINLNDLTGDK